MHVLLHTDMYVPVDMWATTNSALNMDGMSAQRGQDVVRTPPHDSCHAYSAVCVEQMQVLCILCTHV